MLKQKILDRNIRFGVIGLGYVGLPLAVEFAKAGMKVTGFEVDRRKVESLSMGESYIGDVPSSEVAPLVKRGLFSATTDFDELAQMDVVSICVPTPLSKTRDPDMSYVVQATEDVRRRLRKGQLIILESTTYPGTTDELMKVELEKTGLKCGTDFFLAFSPERVDPSNPQYGVKNTPKLVGGVDEVSGELTHLFYSQAIDRVIKLSSAAAAEMSKLLENTFRSVNIGLVNEMALMCERLGLDVWEVIDGAASKPFGFMKFVPGPGVGGHCIPLDPFYLSWKLRTLNYRARFIELAGEINSEMPHYVVRLVSEALNKDRKSVNGSRVLLLGVAYKNDVADMRESPALDILSVLEKEGAQVAYHDSFVPEFRHGDKSYKQVDLTVEELRKADCVVVACKHKGVDWKLVAQHAKLIVDSRNAYPRNGKSPGPARIVKL
ncbi:MAG: nucleotide sugar dehydrogenase [Planctomycetes bacterium]|nr:nucleotide sugar dehydrogenase [Planctomycetota bacterium]